MVNPEIRHKREEVKEVLAEGDLEKVVDLLLCETETIWMLDLPTICVAADSEEAASIQESNQKYKEVCGVWYCARMGDGSCLQTDV